MAPAEGGSVMPAGMLAVIIENTLYNRYCVQLAEPGLPGDQPTPIENAFVSAVNVAESFDESGELEAGTVVLVWPSQGDYTFCFPRPVEPPEPTSNSYWAKIVSGDGPIYTVRRQAATDSESLQDASGAENVSAANVWELTVDPGASAAVPVGAVVRVFEGPDADEQTRRFFFYPIHTVYR